MKVETTDPFLQSAIEKCMRAARAYAGAWAEWTYALCSPSDVAGNNALLKEAELRAAIADCAAGIAGSRWISVDDELPSVGPTGWSSLMLVTDGNSIATRYFDVSDRDSSLCGWRSPRPTGGGQLSGPVKYWMPAPALPS